MKKCHLVAANRHRYIILLLAVLLSAGAWAQQEPPATGAEGVVVDVRTGEPIPFAQVVFVGSRIGAMVDTTGHFMVVNRQGLVTLSVGFVGYKKRLVTLHANRITKGMRIELEPDVYNLGEVTVTASRRKERYSRKNNPAVDLVSEVIAHKEAMRPQKDTSRTEYEKTILALDRFDVDFERNALLEKFSFLRKYIDTAQFNKTPVLTVGLREVLKVDGQERERNSQGVDNLLEREGLAANLDAMFTRVDIFDNTIDLMLNRFVSPLSSSLAVSYYHYYIEDTVTVGGERCVRLMFVPVNRESFGFTGHLYITVDGHRLKRYSISVPPQINMNFVSDLSLDESFDDLPDGRLQSKEAHTYARFYIFKNWRQLYAHHVVHNLDGEPRAHEDAVPTAGSLIERLRPVPLSAKETVIDSLVGELRRVPEFNTAIKAVEIFGSGYIATASERDKSPFDIGPIYNLVSLNPVEGLRLRVGGMTTANLSKHWFMNGYLAFGTRDLRLKYSATAIYSFRPKEFHPFESLRHALYLTTSYDLENPGQNTDLLDRDNILMSRWPSLPPTAMQYARRVGLRYEHEWENRLSVDAWMQYSDIEPAGALQYKRIGANGATTMVSRFADWQAGVQLRYAPGEPLYNNRLGQESPFNLNKDAPVFRFRHTVGRIDHRFTYQRTDIIAEKRFWLSSFGHIDTRLHTGVVWNRAPLPALFTPQSNLTLYLSPNTFTLMRPMEFVADQWAALHATYYLKGWLLNRIPLLNKLKLRAVLSFSGIYGSLSPKNNPRFGHEGLYSLPEGTTLFSTTPYLEVGIGVENILRCIRVDYVRRLTYTDGLRGRDLGGIRIGFRLTI